VIWALVVAALSVFPLPNTTDVLVSIKLTSSGFVMHCVAYSVGMLLCYWAFDRGDIPFILWSMLLIFLYSVILEIAQLYLPYRIFNPKDIVANALGIFFFFAIWQIYSACSSHLRSKGIT